MPVTVVNNKNNSNTTTSTSSTHNNNKTPLTFSAADFQIWNKTTSVVHLPAKLVGKDKIPKLRGETVKAIGEKRLRPFRPCRPRRTASSLHLCPTAMKGTSMALPFRGVTLTPHPAYEEVKSVFVDRAPLQMPDAYLFELLTPYGCVLSIEHLKVKGFQNIKSGTRRVSMVINQSIPAVMKVSNIQLSFRYHGQPPFCFVCQEVGHAGRVRPKSRKASRNTLNNADLSPEDLRHKLHNVKEGDLRVKLNNSKKVGQVPKGGPAATSSSSPPSLITADLPHKPHNSISSSTTGNNNNHIPNGDQSTHIPNVNNNSSSPSLSDTISELKKVFRIPPEMDRKATSVAVSSSAAAQSTASIRKSASSSSASKPSEVLRATLSSLKMDFQQPSEMDSIAKTGAVASFEGLARETQSAAAQSTASVSAKEAVDSGFLVAINGQVVKSTPRIPQTKSFGFSLKPARSSFYSSVPPTSTWSVSYPSATRTRAFGSKGRDTSESDEDYDLPLIKQLCKCREVQSVVSSPAAMEEDSVEECLHGTSVVDPLILEQTSDSAILAPDPVTPVPSVISQDAPAVHFQEAISSPLPEVVSSPEQAETDPPQDAYMPASAFLFGTNDLPSPDLSQDLFTLLTAAPVISDSVASASRLASVSPDVKLFSDPAGQDRVRELMLELPTLNLE